MGAKFQLRSSNPRVKFHDHYSSRLLKSLKSCVGVNYYQICTADHPKSLFQVPMEISHNTIHRWKDRNEIYHVTKYGHPVLRWAPCAQSFVINIPTFYSLGTPFLMRLDPIAQQLFAPVSTRGESTYGRQRPKNTPVLNTKMAPRTLLYAHQTRPPETLLTVPLDWPNSKSRGELSSKHLFFVFGPNSPRLGPGGPETAPGRFLRRWPILW